MIPKFLILCSNVKGNLGDFAILEAIGIQLKEVFPKSQIRYFHHGGKAADERRFQVFVEESAVGLECLGGAPVERRPWLYRNFMKLCGSTALRQRLQNRLIHRLAAELENRTDFIRAIESSDSVFFAGGAQWGRSNLNLNMFAQLELVHRLGLPVGIFPFSITNATVACNGAEALRGYMERLHPPLLVRDVLSYRTLKQLGVDAVHVSDCVLTTEALFREERSVSDRSSNKVYISVTDSGDTTAEGILRLMDRVRSLGLEPILFSSCEMEDRKLVDAVRAIREVDFLAPDSWKATVRLFAESAFVITNRLHCLIFSALGGASVVPIANRNKTKAYAVDAELVIAPESIDALSSELLKEVMSDSSIIRAKQAAYLRRGANQTSVAIQGFESFLAGGS